VTLDQKIFFDHIRIKPFGGSLRNGQVDGPMRILAEWERLGLTDLRWLAYILATTYHETAATMQPVIETRQPSEASNPSVETAIARLEKAWAAGKMPWVKSAYWRKDAAGKSWLGRGLPQVTHKANYERAEKETGVAFTAHPELMLEMGNAVPVMFSAMIKGWFTGKKLADYFNDKITDWVNARKIVNSLDRAEEIAGYAKDFYQALIAAKSGIPTAPVLPAKPLPPLPPVKPPAPSIWSSILALFKRK
jgi:predicted chitinase